ncbi:MAG: hypothetical protein V7760_01160 [Marinobacter sp.]
MPIIASTTDGPVGQSFRAEHSSPVPKPPQQASKPAPLVQIPVETVVVEMRHVGTQSMPVLATG